MSNEHDMNAVNLRPVEFLPAKLLYAINGLPGAMDLPYLADPAIDLLAKASGFVRRSGCEILIWDAFRTRQTQWAIFSAYMARVRLANPGLSVNELRIVASQFVTDPSSVFPHGTGGAVDVTLIREGQELNLGTGFDDFSERSAASYFQLHSPTCSDDREAAHYRQVLRDAMLEAGFVGIETEWWHFEAHTRTWGQSTGRPATLTTVFDNPTEIEPAVAVERRRRFWPALQSGAAASFLSPKARQQALAGEVHGHYYARSSTRSTDDAAAVVADTFNAPAARLLQSGLAAFSCAVRTLLPPGGAALMDQHVYYECATALLEYANLTGARIFSVDLRCETSISEAIAAADGRIDVIVGDSPANWFLHHLPLARLRQIADDLDAKLLLDTSVQPLQKAALAFADLVVVSLSKWPSAGHTIGGAVIGQRSMIDRVTRVAAVDGHAMSAEVAFTVLQQLPTLRDRIATASAKAQLIAPLLTAHPFVRSVRLASGDELGNLIGGMVVLELEDESTGALLEQLIGYNSMCRSLTLPQLACTFGGVISTLEHFGSNVRQRTGLAADRQRTGEARIPSNFVRLSIGSEEGEALADGLLKLLNLVRDRYLYVP